MNTITTLIRKDLSRHGRELAYLIAFELVFILTLAVQLEHLSAGVLLTLAFAVSFMAGFIFSLRTVSSEDASTGMGFLLSLPLSRGHIVLSKFLVNWILVALNFIAVWGGAHGYVVLTQDEIAPELGAGFTLLMLQELNASFFLSCALLFNSARAIWIPFPVLIMAVNLAINWQRVRPLLPTIPVLPGMGPVLLAVGSVALLLLTHRVFSRTAMRHEWA